MQSGFRIGKFFGIHVRIDWSWLLIFFLLSYNLTLSFAQLHPNWSFGLALATGVTASILFFVSILAHEFAHSLVARRQGVPVRSITLFLFGGVSNIQREPPSPRAEFWITVVGPITSLVIGGVILLLANFSAAATVNPAASPNEFFSQLSPVGTLLLWLGTINIVVAVFNLIPGFPLDGGRILRSLVWGATGDLRRATRWATWVGQAFAWLLIIAGVAMIFGAQIPVLGQGLANGIWLIFIGWFLNMAAVQSYQRVVMQDILGDVEVTRLMKTNPPTVTASISIETLVDNHIMREDDYAFPVVEGEKLVGLVTMKDIRKIERSRWPDTAVGDIMTPAAELTTVTPSTDAADTLRQLMQQDVRQIPVVQHDDLVGLIRRRDIIKWLQLNSELEPAR